LKLERPKSVTQTSRTTSRNHLRTTSRLSTPNNAYASSGRTKTALQAYDNITPRYNKPFYRLTNFEKKSNNFLVKAP